MHGETGSTPQMTASEQTLLKTLKMRLQVAGASPLAASKPNQVSTSLREISCSGCRAKVGRICCRVCAHRLASCACAGEYKGDKATG